MIVVGLDPGFASLGVAIAGVPRGVDDVVFTRVTCVTTSKAKELSAAADLTARCWSIADNLNYFVSKGEDFADVFAVCIEGMSYPRHTQAAVKLGASHGVIGGLLSIWQPEHVIVEQPQAVRKRVLNIEKGRTPPEDKVHAHLLDRYPELELLLDGGRKGDRPHILDAAACIVAAYKEGRLDS